MASLIPERLVLELLGRSPTETAIPPLEVSCPEDWSRDIGERIVRLGIAPCLYYRLREIGGLGRLLPEVAREWATAYVRSGIAATQRTRELGAVLTALEAANIPVILLKGMHLALGFYENPALRPMTDIDLLVPRRDLEQVVAILPGLGTGFTFGEPFDLEQVCASQPHLPICYKPLLPGSRIEFHWHIEDPKFPHAIDLDGLWERARPFSALGREVLGLCPEDVILTTCLHVVRHQFYHYLLRAICDINVVCRRHIGELDWCALTDRAIRWRAADEVYLVLELARRTLRAPVPERTIRNLKPEKTDVELLLRGAANVLWEVQERDAAPAVGSNFAALLSLRDPKARLIFLLHRLFPPREEFPQACGLHGSGLQLCALYARRLLRLILRNGLGTIRSLRSGKAARKAIRTAGEMKVLRDWARTNLQSEREGRTGNHVGPL